MATGWILTLGLGVLGLLSVGIGLLQAHAQGRAARMLLDEPPEPRPDPEYCRTCRALTGVLDEHLRRSH
jgi:hypothetical protein